MLVDYPHEWEKYFLKGKGRRTFSKETPETIKEKARDTNDTCIRYAGKPFFFFEEDEE